MAKWNQPKTCEECSLGVLARLEAGSVTISGVMCTQDNVVRELEYHACPLFEERQEQNGSDTRATTGSAEAV